MHRIRSNLDFTKDLVKGKIAEVFFSMMFRGDSSFFVIPFGYEVLIPELARYRDKVRDTHTLKKISSNPDYLLMTSDRQLIKPVDVKYRSNINDLTFLIEKAKETLMYWDDCWYFVASVDGFYFDSCQNIVNKHSLTPLSFELIDKATQDQYRLLLCEFLDPGKIDLIKKAISVDDKQTDTQWMTMCRFCFEAYIAGENHEDCPWCGYDNP